MRFLKALWLAVFFFFTLIFFMQNIEVLGQKLSLHMDFYYFNYVWKNTAVPLYFVVLVGFVAGVLVTLGYLIMDRMRLRFELIRERRKVKKLEWENKKLREIPLQETQAFLEASAVAAKTEDNQAA